ncbi:hypothetical protein FHW00_004978 [Ochrobactrum sp. P6BSIII]|nr:hypothetical protein [Ochrobactrum sp. P6BSIII]
MIWNRIVNQAKCRPATCKPLKQLIFFPLTTDVLALSKEVSFEAKHRLAFLFTFNKEQKKLPQSPRGPFTKDTLFKPIPSSRESVASRTNKAVRSILDAEVDERVAKTLRLRKQRLERTLTAATPVPKKKAQKIK